MTRITVTFIGGAILGVLATLIVTRLDISTDSWPDAAVRDIADVQKMEHAVADKHRNERFANLSSVEELVTLPTEFARMEAMHALAGRSSSADVQNLIYETNRIADDVERVRLLNVLFSRLTELDPRSALVMARSDPFRMVRSAEQTVWRAWARENFEDALFEAKMQSSSVDRNTAAQSLYSAFGFMGNETTERIEAELGVGPDRMIRSRFLYQLADKSPAEAIAFINSLARDNQQQELVSWLAHYLSLRDPDAALDHADLFVVAADGKRYSNIINRNIARDNPRVAIDRWLAGGRKDSLNGELLSAVNALASTDVDAVKRLFEAARSDQERQMLGSAIAAGLVKDDPAEALAWARAHETERHPMLQSMVLMRIAQTDPQLALTKALETPHAEVRSTLVSSVVQQVAQTDPAEAAAYLQQIPGRHEKLEASQRIVSYWVRTDPDAAIDWVFSQEEDVTGHLAHTVATMLTHTDVDAAIRLLPRMDQNMQGSLRQQIAHRLAESRSPIEAQNFIQQFEGQEGYDQLQTSLISGVARTDAVAARQLADQLADGNARDRVYVEVISQRAKTDPRDATRWLRNIGDETMRAAATGQLAMHWYQHDPGGASRWVASLPVGSLRDSAIVHMSSAWRDISAEQEQLIASIQDPNKRGQAKIQRIYRAMQTNPAKARELLNDADITDSQRQQVEATLNRVGVSF